VLRTRQPFTRSRPSALLFWATVVVAFIALALPYAGRLAGLFDFVPLPATIVAASIAVVAAYIATTEALKLVFYRRLAKRR
jgi:Mg2+-importing ATPase